MGIFDASSLPSGPTSQSIATSNISPWAQPYINQYLSNAQNLASQGPTGFQNQVYSSAQNMGMPEQFAQGSNLANQAGQGHLASAPIAYGYGAKGSAYGDQGVGLGITGGALYGGMGAGIGQQATQAQQNYQNMATSPQAMQAYMNPYIQQSLDPQLKILNQQQALQAQDINARAAGQGAFGGNRATLAQGLNAQNFDLARQQAIGQGYDTAFKNAQQAQQFGSSLGLQGLGVGIQGAQTGLQGVGTQLAGTAQGMQGAQVGLQGVSGAQAGYSGATQAGAALGNLGAQQGQYQLGALALQNQIANQQYNQPFQNQQYMRDMMAGLPITQQTTQGYQAPPNALSQIGGIGTTLIGGLGALNKSGLLDGAGNAVKNWWNSPSNSTTPNINYDANGAVINSGISYPTGGGGYTTSSGNEVNAGEYSAGAATGGYIRNGGVKSYASGGLVSLALAKALKG